MLAAALAVIFALAVAFSALGLGGAMLHIPVLEGLGFDFKRVALPTALFLNGLTTLSTAVAHGRAGLVDWRGGLPLIATSLMAVLLGALGTRHVPTETLILLFALGMAGAGIRMVATAGRPDPVFCFRPGNGRL